MGAITLHTLVHVRVPRPIPQALTYKVPEALADKVKVGSYVLVPFRSNKIEGFVTTVEKISDLSIYETSYALKEILDCPYEEPVFQAQDLKFFEWISEYYQIPLGEVFHSAFSKAFFTKEKKARVSKTAATKDVAAVDLVPADLVPADLAGSSQKALILTPDQKSALDQIQSSIAQKNFKSFLLFGVTGSGKTEVYIQAAQKALEQGRSALILVPEIALTPQLRRRFEERFGGGVAVLHSSLGPKARREHWWHILRGQKKVVVGARSALFAPLKDIGLIVVDEEHEPSYKQEDRLRYNARDLAVVRARLHSAAVILGSATPSIETYFAAQKGKHTLLELQNRPGVSTLPQIEIVDLKAESDFRKERVLFSTKLLEGLQQTFERGEQAMVFMNRKGYSSFVMCQGCGDVPKCLNCSVSLTYYQSSHQLKCHYCGFNPPAPDHCASCKSPEIKCMGLGTELVEEQLRSLFPNVSMARLDADVAETPKKLESILDDFRQGKTQMLVGTQMLAKGHDFPNVTFVGVVLADMSLHLPDFRSAERTFQLLAQVAGRAGRADKPGRVVLQTYIPDSYVIQAASQQDYKRFYAEEVVLREEFLYPPFSRMAQVEFRDLKELRAKGDAEKARRLLDHLDSLGLGVTYLGPAAASIAKIANQYRWQILLRSEKSAALNAIIKTLRKEGVRFIDVDPVSTL
jgi:primosomal protein N' (replication factor Y)